MSTEKYIGEAALNNKPGKKLTLVIKDGSVTEEKIKDKAVTNKKIALESVSRSNLSNDVRASIDKKADAEQVNNSLYDLEKKIGERFVVEGDVTNLPDEEDLTSVKESERDVLKLADRSYAPEKFSGKGYKILRKNIKPVSLAITEIVVSSVPTSDGYLAFIINGVESHVDVVASTDTTTDKVAEKIATKLKDTMYEYNVSKSASTITLTRKFGGIVSTPSSFSAVGTGASCSVEDCSKIELRNIITPVMINQSNCIYEIRYDFDLDGETIEIPEGCTLKFEGGSLKNGILKGRDTSIISKPQQIFSCVLIEGTWSITDIYSAWFDFVPQNGDSKYDNTDKLVSLFALTSEKLNNNVFINSGNFWINANNDDIYRIMLKSNTHVFNSATIHVFGSNKRQYYLFYAENKQNIVFEGGELIGDIDSHIGTGGELYHGLCIRSCTDVIIKNAKFSNFWGDGIDLIKDGEKDAHNENIRIDNVICDNNRRQGISIEDGVNIFMSNSLFSNTGNTIATSPAAGIDIEPVEIDGYDCLIHNVIISDCNFINNKIGIACQLPNVSGIRISNCDCGFVYFDNVKDATLKEPIRITSSNIDCLSFHRNCANIMIDNCSIHKIVGEASFSNELCSLNNISINNSVIETTSDSYNGFLINLDGEFSDVIIRNSFLNIKKATKKLVTQIFSTSYLKNVTIDNCTINCSDWLNVIDLVIKNSRIYTESNIVLSSKTSLNFQNNDIKVNRSPASNQLFMIRGTDNAIFNLSNINISSGLELDVPIFGRYYYGYDDKTFTVNLNNCILPKSNKKLFIKEGLNLNSYSVFNDNYSLKNNVTKIIEAEIGSGYRISIPSIIGTFFLTVIGTRDENENVQQVCYFLPKKADGKIGFINQGKNNYDYLAVLSDVCVYNSDDVTHNIYIKSKNSGTYVSVKILINIFSSNPISENDINFESTTIPANITFGNMVKYGNSRPKGTLLTVGSQFFDTTLNKPIYWSGTKWVDSAGLDV